MKELVVISGKGGTGKTSLTSSFAALAEKSVLADCDVDAADLHLILEPNVKQTTDFISGNEAIIDEDKCLGCGACWQKCRFDAINRVDVGQYRVDSSMCEGCGVCVEICPADAVDFPESSCGQWFISDTRFGPMVHAKLGIAAENSGKLVSVVREEARKLAQEQNSELIVVDGPPGTGCPVIASITGTDAVLVVTEPTMSGIHDLERVRSLTKHFDVPTFICVNKWDLNPENTKQIEKIAEESGCHFVGKVPYTKEITAAQVQGKSVIESGSEELKTNIKEIWGKLCSQILK
ncbi:Cell division inhibitor MinD [Sedimentisphaera cyanobacteriorum]|uniref:Cell division inhibitor MinD n=1 Tax=Sedimentisphaera cyanobacteriorum TaxID=1940790 RepID=A0A1Q2HRV5_9BACT|nr:ATP-binding protein [Sedimentisphaera cyanobacteriorum]AQQ10004.1 Cell division inhibitor MinD [Sedimentisphaera cyanobacteriorum]